MNLIKPQRVIKSIEVAGIAMGVLEDGTAFVNARGVATLTGMAISTILHHATRWREGKRDSELHQHLIAHGVSADRPTVYTPAIEDGRPLQHAYPDWVVIEYLRFYSADNEVADDNFRKLAGHALREYIYEKAGYQRPARSVQDEWRHFHDRLLMIEVPDGQFCVFKEIAPIIASAIREQVPVDSHTMPDGSVGQIWGKYWEDQQLDKMFGARARFEHNFPAYFPQAISNPQHPWSYPLGALGEFRLWLESVYLPQKYPEYLAGKVRQGVIAEGTARNVLKAVRQSPDSLPAITRRRALPAPAKPRALAAGKPKITRKPVPDLD